MVDIQGASFVGICRENIAMRVELICRGGVIPNGYKPETVQTANMS